jgi:subtilisin family serine protease
MMNQTEAKRRPRPAWRSLVAVLVVAVTATVGATATPAAAEAENLVRPNGIVVRLSDGRDLRPLLRELDLRVAEPLLASRDLWLVEPSSGELEDKDLEKLAKEVARADGVRWAELDTGEDDPEDDRFHAWPDGLPVARGHDPARWTDQPGLTDLRLDEAHRYSTGEGIVVAVLDTGVDLDHPYLRDHLGSGHYDYVDDDRDPTESGNGLDDDGDGLVDESYGHGTHAAGLVALVAPDAEILVYRVLDADGHGHPLVIAQAVEDAIAAGADVINISFGMATKPKSKVLREAFKRAREHDVSVVAAVGNDGRKTEQYPAREKEVLGVAAMGRDNRQLAHFSNYGKPAVVAAPGEEVVSTLPGGGFGAWSGTSMAAPIVAGQVALVRSHSPDLKAKEVIEAIAKSASEIRGKRKIGEGLIDIVGSIEE